jgi:hypothetical protein
MQFVQLIAFADPINPNSGVLPSGIDKNYTDFVYSHNEERP